jgi:signal transduction histidine kinase
MLFLLLFAVVFAIAGAVILTTTEAAMLDEVKSQITENVNLLRDTLTTEGAAALVEFVDDATPPRAPRHVLLGLFTPDGSHLAGDILHMPDFHDWGRISLPTRVGGPDYLAYVAELHGMVIVAGGSLAFMNASVAGLWRALLLSGVLVAIGALVIGATFSFGVSAKLNTMADTLDHVSRGNTAIRLPIGRSNDQVDRISQQINAHLDRLSELMGNMRRTVIAVAHDLKSPLSRVYILLQEAATAEEPAKTEALEHAQDEIEALSGIVDTVLRISRIESSDDRSGFSRFTADSLVADIAQTFLPVVEGEGCMLVYEPSVEDTTIFGDSRMLHQLLANLIENATRYCPPGSTITLSSARKGERVEISVADNGPGIPPEHRGEVLEPFYQVSPERDPRGAGLGLALVKAIVTRHRAAIELADNTPGLRVTVSFPKPESLY